MSTAQKLARYSLPVLITAFAVEFVGRALDHYTGGV